MDVPEPTREQAQAALLEADQRVSQVRHADLQLRWMLLTVLAAYAVAAVLISLSGPRRGSALAAWTIVAALVAAIVFAVVVGLRIRAYSRAGIRMYFATFIAFNLWNTAVASTSIATGFWALGRPAYDFGISAAIGVIPLAVGAALVGRRP